MAVYLPNGPMQSMPSNPVQPPTMSGGGLTPMPSNPVQPPGGNMALKPRYITGNEPTMVRDKMGNWVPAPTPGIGIPTGDNPMQYITGHEPNYVPGPGGQMIPNPRLGTPSDPSRNMVSNMPTVNWPGSPSGDPTSGAGGYPVQPLPGGGGQTPPWASPGPGPGGGMPPGGGGQMPPWQNVNGGGAYGDYNDPFNAYLSMIPVMQNQMMKDVGGAMAGAGFGGNRYGTSAMNQAGQIGAESAMKMNQMLNQTMFDQSNRDLDRAMQSTKMFGDWSLQEDQGERDWMHDLMDWGQYEQGRQDKYGMLGYQDFENNKLGYLPYLIQALSGTGAGSSPQPYQVMTDPGQSGWGDEAGNLFKNLLEMFK